MVNSSGDEMCILFIAMFTSIADVAAMLNVRDISCRVIVMIEPRMWSVVILLMIPNSITSNL